MAEVHSKIPPCPALSHVSADTVTSVYLVSYTVPPDKQMFSKASDHYTDAKSASDAQAAWATAVANAPVKTG